MHKKPIIEDFGITEQEVKTVEEKRKVLKQAAKKRINEENKAKEYMGKTIAVTIALGIFFAIITKFFATFLIIVLFGAIIGYVVYLCTKPNEVQQDLSYKDKEIEKKYQLYLNELEKYNENNALYEKAKETIKTKPKIKEIKEELNHIQEEANSLYERAKEIIKRKAPKKETAITKNEKKAEPYVITYKTANISLTQKQKEIFEEMIALSKEYCLDLELEERRQIVGIGIINKERLRFYLVKKNGKVCVRFNHLGEYITLIEKNREKLLENTKKVNYFFEKNPERYQLAKYRAELDEIEKKEKETALIKKKEEDIFTTFDDIDDSEEDNFDAEFEESWNKMLNDDFDDINDDDDNKNDNKSLIYDETIYTIQNKTLIKFIGKDPHTSSYEIPEGIEIIGKDCFSDTNIVYEIKIPNTVEKIEDNAFKNCTKLNMIILPASITEIGKNAFDGCNNLETIFVQTKKVKNLLNDLPKKIEIVCLEF